MNTLQNLAVSQNVTGLVTWTSGATFPINFTDTTTFSDGTGNLQGHSVLSRKSRTLNATSEDINLTTDLDPSGAAPALTKLVFMRVKYDSGTAGSYLTVKQATSNGVPNVFLAAGDGVKLAVGEVFERAFIIARTVTASTGDLFTVTSTVSDAVYTSTIVGS